jgi:hypothetical protein
VKNATGKNETHSGVTCYRITGKEHPDGCGCRKRQALARRQARRGGSPLAAEWA